MKSVILISDRPIDLDAFGEAFRAYGRVHRDPQSKSRIVIQLNEEGWFDVECDQSIHNEFDDEELVKLSQLIQAPVFAGISYSDDHVADVIIKLLPLAPDTLVDNDHGLVLPVEEIRKRIQSGRKWQTASV
jgi:hypothetical protein